MTRTVPPGWDPQMVTREVIAGIRRALARVQDFDSARERAEQRLPENREDRP